MIPMTLHRHKRPNSVGSPIEVQRTVIQLELISTFRATARLTTLEWIDPSLHVRAADSRNRVTPRGTGNSNSTELRYPQGNPAGRTALTRSLSCCSWIHRDDGCLYVLRIVIDAQKLSLGKRWSNTRNTVLKGRKEQNGPTESLYITPVGATPPRLTEVEIVRRQEQTKEVNERSSFETFGLWIKNTHSRPVILICS
ncbi:unnamed protein product [Caenorhabditis sp. 36 PRJEB53466]|nr:unnamed protein product [Caenorhabditis sp. 36 PRJEB53466]